MQNLHKSAPTNWGVGLLTPKIQLVKLVRVWHCNLPEHPRPFRFGFVRGCASLSPKDFMSQPRILVHCIVESTSEIIQFDSDFPVLFPCCKHLCCKQS